MHQQTHLYVRYHFDCINILSYDLQSMASLVCKYFLIWLLICLYGMIVALYKQNIIVNMDKKEYTSSRHSRHTSATLLYTNQRQPYRGGIQITLIRQYELLKTQAQRLQMQNRQLTIDVQKLKYDKTIQDNKFLSKGHLQQQTLTNLHKQKNNQIQIIKTNNQEQINRSRRQYQIKIQNFINQINNRNNLTKEMNSKQQNLQLISNELKTKLQTLQLEISQIQNNNSNLSQKLTHEQFDNKKLSMLVEQIENQKTDMEIEIHLLLDIQAQKTNAIQILQQRLDSSQNQYRKLQQSIALLSSKLAKMESEIIEIKENLKIADIKGQQVCRTIERVQKITQEKQFLIQEQHERLQQLRTQITMKKERESEVLGQIQDLISQNERIYHQLVFIRHQLYEVSINQEINI